MEKYRCINVLGERELMLFKVPSVKLHDSRSLKTVKVFKFENRNSAVVSPSIILILNYKFESIIEGFEHC